MKMVFNKKSYVARDNAGKEVWQVVCRAKGFNWEPLVLVSTQKERADALNEIQDSLSANWYAVERTLERVTLPAWQ